MIWITIASVILVLYCLFIFSIYKAWKKNPPYNPFSIKASTFISVIVPARNEAGNIHNILNDIIAQDYPKELFDVLVMNDHSDDRTHEIAEQLCSSEKNIHLIDLPENKSGKKEALLLAYKKAKGKLIITTDADCRVGKYWLSTIESFYLEFSPKLIICPLLYTNEKGPFEHMQSLESLSLVTSGAGCAILNKPILCNGANLAFDSDVLHFYEKEIKTDVASGDDIFLMAAIKKNWPNSIHFLKSIHAVAYTCAEPTLQKFLNQRKRWTSKSKWYTDKDIIVVGLLVFVANGSLLTSFILGFFNPLYFLLYFVLLLLKSCVDILLLHSFASFFNKKKVLKYFAATQIIYPLYIIFMGIYGNLGKFEWKNRIYR